MGRLKGKGLGSRLGSEHRRLRGPAATEEDRTRQRDETVQWRKWYKTSRWQKLRRLVIRRDDSTCRQTGLALIGRHPAPNSPVVDHIIPHNGDASLFWDADNLQTVSKAWHDKEKQRMERAGLV